MSKNKWIYSCIHASPHLGTPHTGFPFAVQQNDNGPARGDVATGQSLVLGSVIVWLASHVLPYLSLWVGCGLEVVGSRF